MYHKRFHDLCSLPNIIWMIKPSTKGWVGHVIYTGERRGAYRVLVGKPEGRRPLGRPMRRWEDNITMNLQEVGWKGGMDWIDQAQTRTDGEYD